MPGAVRAQRFSTARSERGPLSSSTTSAARGGPQVAMRACIRTPNVFHGLTNLCTISSPLPTLAWTIAAPKLVRPCASASAGTSSSATGRLTASSSVTPKNDCARDDMACTSRAESITRKASPLLGSASSRASRSSPRPHDGHTRAVGGGGLPPGDGAAQWPQNHDHRMEVSMPPSTSLNPGLCVAVNALCAF